MKRYLFFAAELYYPGGGAHDLRGHYDTVEETFEALRAFKQERIEQGQYENEKRMWEFSFAHYLDTRTGEVVELNGC